MEGFDVRRNSAYRELTITIDSVKASSGLLDEAEAVGLAKELIYAAEQLLPAGTEEIENQLCKARESL